MRGKMLHAGQVAARSLGMFWLFGGGVLWRISSAQTPGQITLPTEMQGNLTIPDMRTHFCQGFNIPPTEATPQRDDPFCLQINRVDYTAFNRQCWRNLGNSLIDNDRPNCKAHQELYCQYRDAVVCQYTSPGRMTHTLGSCVYHSGSDEPFCICENDDGMWPTTGHESRCSEFETTTTTHPTSAGLEQDQDVNVVAIVLGCILSLLLLLIIIGVVILYLRRQGKLSFLGRKRSKRGDKSPSPDDVSGMNDSNRAPMPEPLVLGAVEYSYACDRRPSEPTNKPKTREPKSDDENHYYSISDDHQGNQPYGRGNAPSTSREGPSSTEAPDDHPQSEDGEFGPSFPKPSSSHKEASDDTYFPLIPTSPGASSVYKTLAVVPVSDGSDASSPHDHIDGERKMSNKQDASQNDVDGTSNENYDRITPNGVNNKET